MSQAADLKPVFTIGHSNFELEVFLGMLHSQHVELLIDVRSRPQSGRFPQFSQPGFQAAVEKAGVSYLFLGEELGGRPDDADVYRQDGVVDYVLRRKSYAFCSGVERVLSEAGSRSVALLCAEEDPLECHRFLMICPELVARAARPIHIRKGGKLETQEDAENRLLQCNGLGGFAVNSLFPDARRDALEDAYRLQSGKFAFRVDPAHLAASW
ncbi:MAG TPA: DUF488 domain-containing protein [Terriglobia bacterium]|nr:DUF488 domain-containing protein [Terriglobia bacterium]